MRHTAQTFMDAALKASRLDSKQTVFVINLWTGLNQWQLAIGQGYEMQPAERKAVLGMVVKAGVAYTRVTREPALATTADMRFNCQVAMKALEAVVDRKTNKKGKS